MKNKSGFTLVEILIATLVLLLIVGAFLSTLMKSSHLITGRSQEDIALSAAQGKFEDMRRGISTITSYPNTTAFDVAGLTLPPGQPSLGTVTVAKLGSTGLYDVTVNMTWRQPDGYNVTRSLRTTVLK